MFAATLSWTNRNSRSSGVAAAFAAFLVIAFETNPPDGILEALVVILPATEAGLFALVFAIVRDDEPPMLGAPFTVALWGASVFVAIWLLVEVTQASIEAYVQLGAPPMTGLSY